MRARDGYNSGSGCARAARSPSPRQRRTTTSAFFFETAHGGILGLEFRTHARLGLRRPLVHGGAAQLAQLLDQQHLDLIGGFERASGGVRQIEDALLAGQHLRLLPELLDKLSFLRRELGAAAVRFHPDFIGVNRHACHFIPQKSFSLTHF